MTTKEFLEVLEILQRYIDRESPSSILKKSFKRTPFTILIATILSLRTKDENTARVCKELFCLVNTPQSLLKIKRDELEKLIRPVGMYRKKAQILRGVSKDLICRFDSIVPSCKDDLLSLKGVGEKTANIVLNNAFNIPSIAVDTHVHRIANLLGFVDTKNAKDTERMLCQKIPYEFWNRVNFFIVSFGQTICLPNHPKCNKCKIKKYCRQET